MPDKELLTVKEAADLAGVCRSKVYEYINRGEWVAVKLDGSTRIPRTPLMGWIQERVDKGVLEAAARKRSLEGQL